MFLILLISGTFFIPCASSLRCNVTRCHPDVEECGGEVQQCGAEFTHCGSLRQLIYQGNSKDTHELEVSCFKEEDCQDGSFNFGIARYYFTSSCCNTDKCNKELPRDPNFSSKPNGRKCHQCDGGSDCSGVLNCEGEETFCVTYSEQDEVLMGCGTRSICVNPSSRLVILADTQRIECCEGDYCNGAAGVNNGGRDTNACVLLQTTMLISIHLVINALLNVL